MFGSVGLGRCCRRCGSNGDVNKTRDDGDFRGKSSLFFLTTTTMFTSDVTVESVYPEKQLKGR